MNWEIVKNSFYGLRYVLTGKHDYNHIPHSISTELDINCPLDYYIDLKPKIKYDGQFDKQGVFLFYINKKYGWQYYPITIFNYGIAAYQNFIESDEKQYLNILLSQANWALETQEKSGRLLGTWKFNFDLPMFDLKSGWISAMAQGLGISLLLRIWKLTNDNRYLESAEMALEPFDKLVDTGGVKTIYKDRWVVYEEYPSNPPSFVLNGYISALLGLRDMWIFRNNTNAMKLWDQGIQTSIHVLPDYDLGFWSRYDLRDKGVNIASFFYHRYHITQLELMYKLTGETVFKEYAEKFLAYTTHIENQIKAIVKKTIWRFRRL